MKPIPTSILAALGRGVWQHGKHKPDFAALLKWHAAGDARTGTTSVYLLRDTSIAGCPDSVSASELDAMARDGGIAPFLHRGHAVNQHWLHSIEQFFGECHDAWLAHVKRTEALRGTPAGTIGSRDEVEA